MDYETVGLLALTAAAVNSTVLIAGIICAIITVIIVKKQVSPFCF